MVITVFWTHSWTVPIISVSILCVAVILLVFCLCIQKKQKLDVSSPRKLLNFSNNSLNKLTTFRSYKNEPKSMESEKLGSDSDLLDDDSFNGFKSSCLKIDDDVESCASCDSRYTFYSTYPGVTRSGSNVSDTYKSIVCM